MSPFQYTYGSRCTMTPIEQAFARVYDRLRKRTARTSTLQLHGYTFGFHEGYEAGFKAALAELSQDNEMQYQRQQQEDYAAVR